MMIDRFSKIQKFVADQARLIEYDTGLLVNATENVMTSFRIDQQLHQIIFNIETMQNHLDNIIEAITFAKLKIISKHILNQNETEIIKDIMLKQGISIATEEDLYNIIWLQAYRNHTQLIFSIQIPEYNPLDFIQYELTQTFINNSYIIPIPNHKILINTQFYQYITEPCATTRDFISCENKGLTLVTNTCVPAIINNIPAQCNLTKILPEEKIYEIKKGQIYVYTKQQTPFESNCNQNQKAIKGQNIIEFNKCTIQIMNNTFTVKLQQIYEDKSLKLPYNDIIPEHIKTPIAKEELERLTIQHVQAIEHLSLSHMTQKTHTTIVYGIIITLSCILVVYVFYRLQKTICKKTSENGPRTTCWPFLRGEELRHQTPRGNTISIPLSSS